jgi:predicted ATP-binding protein involved in virulence
MFRKILVIVTATAISLFCLSGCKKRTSESESGEEALKTMAEHEAEAKEQINKENMADELERIEKAMEQEISQEQ